MTKLKIKPNLPYFAGERSNHKSTKLACMVSVIEQWGQKDKDKWFLWRFITAKVL